MHMSFEKIEPAEDKPEHPAARAARMIKGYHEETIARIDGGFIFMREGVDCNAELREACVKGIAECEEVILRTSDLDYKSSNEAMAILMEAQGVDGETKRA